MKIKIGLTFCVTAGINLFASQHSQHNGQLPPSYSEVLRGRVSVPSSGPVVAPSSARVSVPLPPPIIIVVGSSAAASSSPTQVTGKINIESFKAAPSGKAPINYHFFKNDSLYKKIQDELESYKKIDSLDIALEKLVKSHENDLEESVSLADYLYAIYKNEKNNNVIYSIKSCEIYKKIISMQGVSGSILARAHLGMSDILPYESLREDGRIESYKPFIESEKTSNFFLMSLAHLKLGVIHHEYINKEFLLKREKIRHEAPLVGLAEVLFPKDGSPESLLSKEEAKKQFSTRFLKRKHDEEMFKKNANNLHLSKLNEKVEQNYQMALFFILNSIPDSIVHPFALEKIGSVHYEKREFKQALHHYYQAFQRYNSISYKKDAQDVVNKVSKLAENDSEFYSYIYDLMKGESDEAMWLRGVIGKDWYRYK